MGLWVGLCYFHPLRIGLTKGLAARVVSLNSSEAPSWFEPPSWSLARPPHHLAMSDSSGNLVQRVRPKLVDMDGGPAQKIPSHKSHKTYTIEHPLDAPREFRMWIVGWLSKLRPLPLIEKLCQREIGSTNIWNHHLDNPIGPRYLKIPFDFSSPFPAKQHNLCGPTFEYSTFTTFGATQDDLRN